ERHRLTVTHLLITHADHDHVAGNDVYAARFGVPVAAHEIEAARMNGADLILAHGDRVSTGGLEIEALLTPGHSPGHLAFRINSTDCFTGDVLFKDTVGGTLNDSFGKLKPSIMDVLMGLPHDTVVHPGHTDPTTIGAEWEANPYVRIWRGLDPEGEQRCTALDRPARLVLFSGDYDGGHKGWVRWDETGEDDIVPGSRVKVSSGSGANS
ncbi:MAG: MBL fold metallo-hydrolase, partial [Gaiellales bacterium]